jgi:drug/metabolite transporter (DMT)-like permease
MENADIWQISIYRSISWITALLIILFFKYRLEILKQIFAIGRWGVIAGVFLASAQIFYMHALDNTTVANVMFILSAIPFVTAITAFLFIKEKIKLPTILMMMIAVIGIFIMVSEGVKSGNVFGNLMALITLLCFSCFPVILRNNRHIDMLPTLLVPAVIIGLVGLMIKGSDLTVSSNDLALSFIWGGLLNGFAHSIFIIATRHLLAAEITLFMLLEFTLGPLWVWSFIGETPSINTLIGGGIVMAAIATLTVYELLKRRKLNNIIQDIGWNDDLETKNSSKKVFSEGEVKMTNGTDNFQNEDENKEILDDHLREKIRSELQGLLLPSLNKWMDQNLSKIIKHNFEEQFKLSRKK